MSPPARRTSPPAARTPFRNRWRSRARPSALERPPAPAAANAPPRRSSTRHARSRKRSERNAAGSASSAPHRPQTARPRQPPVATTSTTESTARPPAWSSRLTNHSRAGDAASVPFIKSALPGQLHQSQNAAEQAAVVGERSRSTNAGTSVVVNAALARLVDREHHERGRNPGSELEPDAPGDVRRRRAGTGETCAQRNPWR